MLGVAAVASLLVLAVGWYWTAHEERELTQALAQREERMTQLVARGFAGPVWNLDGGAIDNLIDAVMADPEVHSIELHFLGVKGAPVRRERAAPAVEPMQRDFNIFHESAPDDAPVARARLVFTRALVEQQVRQTRQFVAGLLAAVLAAVMVTCYVLVKQLVLGPVSRLGALARRVAGGQLGVHTRVERADEIGALTHQFNQMSEQLKTSSGELRRSEERYRSLFENATEGIFQADARGRLLDLNRALAQMLGFSRPEAALATGMRLRLLACIEAPEYKRIAGALQRHRVLQQVPMLIATREGRQLWVELSAHVVPGGDGQNLRVEGMVSDISQRRLAEQELTRHRDHLEELVAERTTELSLAKQRAEAANQSKSRFLATMSHEFRTPLNAILGFAQLLQMDASLGPAQKSKVDLIRDSGDHLLHLIGDVLDMASIEAGRVRLAPQVLDLRALLEVSCDAMRLRAEQKGLQFRIELDAELPSRVLADGQRLRQVLLNLLSNAVKFTDAGFLALQVRALATEPDGTRIRFAVSDSGIGLRPDQIARLFQPFEQLADEAHRHGGTGLGLSISQQLVRLMGGQIEVGSEPQVGSCFSFELVLLTPAG
ncbi:MAG: ATP-binding protein [Burkholderiaceae bacterium]